MALSEEQKRRIEAEEKEKIHSSVSHAPHYSQKYGLPAVLSLFIPGVGQMVKGQIGRGILILIGCIFGYMFFVIPGLIIHIWNIIDAYNKPA